MENGHFKVAVFLILMASHGLLKGGTYRIGAPSAQFEPLWVSNLARSAFPSRVFLVHWATGIASSTYPHALPTLSKASCVPKYEVSCFQGFLIYHGFLDLRILLFLEYWRPDGFHTVEICRGFAVGRWGRIMTL